MKSQNSRRWRHRDELIVVFILAVSFSVIIAFQFQSDQSAYSIRSNVGRRGKFLSVVKESQQMQTFSVPKQEIFSSKYNPLTQKFGGDSVTSNIISQLAIFALKRRLSDHINVDCDVAVDAAKVTLMGKVGPVKVKGKGWKSPLGLTCRAIEANVDECSLDFVKVLQKRKLHLTVPAQGNAMVALTGADFGSFVTHPLLKSPEITINGRSQPFKFLKDSVLIDPTSGEVRFFGTFQGERWRCILKRKRKGEAEIKTFPVNGSSVRGKKENIEEIMTLSKTLSKTISAYFNDLIFELDGTFLSFQDLMVSKIGRDPSVMISLKILVKKFPSTGIAF